MFSEELQLHRWTMTENRGANHFLNFTVTLKFQEMGFGMGFFVLIWVFWGEWVFLQDLSKLKSVQKIVVNTP